MAQSRSNVLQASLVRLVRRGAWTHVGRLLAKTHPAEIAEALDRLTPADRKAVFDLIRSDAERAEVLATLEFAAGTHLLGDLDPEVAGRIVRHMSTDDASALLRELPRDRTDQILAALGEEAEDVESLLAYPEGTAGALMSPDYLALEEDLSVKAAIERVQRMGRSDASFYVYVVDERQKLVGVLSLRQLITQPPDKLLRDFMTPDPLRVTPDADQEEVSRIVARYDLLAVPVVDASNRLVGVVTVDDVIDVLRDQTTEELLKVAGTSVEEVGLPGPLRGAWLRLPWLAVSFSGGLLGIYLLARFEPVLERMLQIAFFLPVVLGMGGNLANQCAMVVVRGLATGQLALHQVGRILRHELGTGLLLALLFSAALLGMGLLMGFEVRRLPLVVALGLFTLMSLAAALGTVMPLAFRRLGVDPAIASGPLVTTAIDVLGIAAFFSIAHLLL
jgi:magnesium transporter